MSGKEQEEAMGAGSERGVEKYASLLYEMAGEIRQSEDALLSMKPLLDSQDPDTRLMAACFLGEISDERALLYLQNLANVEKDFRARVKLDDLDKRGKVPDWLEYEKPR